MFALLLVDSQLNVFVLISICTEHYDYYYFAYYFHPPCLCLYDKRSTYLVS